MGRVVANKDFLYALLKADPYDQYHFYFSNPEQLSAVSKALRADFPDLGLHFGLWADLPATLQTTRFELFHLSDWVVGFVPLAALRNYYSRHIFPITGIIHSVSYARYHMEFLKHLWPGCTPRDAIAVTSRAGQAVMEEAFAQLRANYHLPDHFSRPELIRLPLGISQLPDMDEIARLRARKRESLGLRPDDVLLLYLGRLSYATKKDMLPLLRALSRAGRQGLDLASVRLVLAGWLEMDDDIVRFLADFARALGINLTIIPRPSDTERSELYAAADIFVSLVDNLQETFGITILEAGAYALPVIASDFDGYRDLVVHGETGWLIPSLGPRKTAVTDLLAHFWGDYQLHLFLAQETAVDVAKTADCLVKLVKDPGLRRSMGQSGRARVAAEFLWEKIIPRYMDMWESLAKRPLPDIPPAAAHPQYLSYARLFARHFSRQLDDDLQVVWSKSGEALYRGREKPIFYADMEQMIPLNRLERLMFLARNPVSTGALAKAFAGELTQEQIDYLLLWALKHDFLELCS